MSTTTTKSNKNSAAYERVANLCIHRLEKPLNWRIMEKSAGKWPLACQNNKKP